VTEPVILLPGMMCDARLFASQTAVLSATRPVMVAPLSSDDTITAMAASILQHAPPRFALAGLSMGGIVAMEVIRQAPGRITRLALMDTNPLAEAPERAKLRDEQIARVLGGELKAVIRDDMKPHYLADGSDRRTILDLCMDMAVALGPDVFARQSRALQSRPDQCETLRGVDVPTLILHGAEDRLCPPERHELMRDLVPGATLARIDDAGHLPTLEQPKPTNKALEKWLTL
jgi:pimeloyl-ACP methyl ester carboxylesterase